jgi:hypothetical protein
VILNKNPVNKSFVFASIYTMSAYLLPYFVNDQNQIKVLCAQKQVLSYEAIGSWRSSIVKKSEDWHRLADKVATNGNILQADGRSEGRIGRRLEGMLLPAGGKMAFFGGRIKRGWEEFLIIIRPIHTVLHLLYYLNSLSVRFLVGT